MKLTKLTAVTLASLSMLALAEPTFAATENGNANENNGQALPQEGTTKAGISFGDDSDTGNIGDLRLSHVPGLLDFGNHSALSTAGNYNAAGLDASSTTQGRPGYKNDTNETTVKTGTNKVYLQVTDEQSDRKFTDNNGVSTDSKGLTEVAGKYDAVAGDWKVGVKADGPMTMTKNGTKSDLQGVNLVFNNGTLADQVKTDKVDAGDKPDFISSAVVVPMNSDSSNTDQAVISASTGKGQGISEADWTQDQVLLQVPKSQNTGIQDGRYEASITWTLSSDVK